MKKIHHAWRTMMGILFLLFGTMGMAVLKGCGYPAYVAERRERLHPSPQTQPASKPAQQQPMQPTLGTSPAPEFPTTQPGQQTPVLPLPGEPAALPQTQPAQREPVAPLMGKPAQPPAQKPVEKKLMGDIVAE